MSMGCQVQAKALHDIMVEVMLCGQPEPQQNLTRPRCTIAYH